MTNYSLRIGTPTIRVPLYSAPQKRTINVSATKPKQQKLKPKPKK
jgi:hypothetical protein